MQGFTSVTGAAAPMPAAHIDTDVIMPKQFLKGIDRANLDRGVFFDLRFDAQGNKAPDFILNQAGLGGSALSGGRAEFRLRLQPRACGLGVAANRHPRADRHQLRRYFQR